MQVDGLSNSVLTAVSAAEGHMSDAAASIAAGDLGDYVDASVSMTKAKLEMSLAARLFRIEDEIAQSTLSILA